MSLRSHLSDDRPPTGRLAAVLGNAGLLGVGYLLMRRWRAFIVSSAVSAVLLSLVIARPDYGFWRILLIAWWVVVVLHGWGAAHRERHGFRLDRNERIALWRNRLIALLCLLPAAFGWFRFDTWRIMDYAEAAHTAGDCDRAAAALGWLDQGHRLANEPAVERGEAERAACEQLIDALAETDPKLEADGLASYIANPDARWAGAGTRRAEALFEAAWSSEHPSMGLVEDGFAAVSATLRDEPGQTEAVLAIVEEYRSDLADLAESHPCRAERINAWLDGQTWESPELAEVLAPEAEAWPERMIACAESWGATDEAGELYRTFLTRFPDHALAEEAISGLLDGELYCDFPTAYAAAPAYEGGGPHPARFFGIDPEEYGFSDDWQAASVGETELAVCVEGPERGGYQETCYYEPGADDIQPIFGGTGYEEVKFYASRFTVKAYEIRTGELVEDYSEEIGDPCPDELEYEYHFLDIVPGEYDSDYSDADVRGIFAPIMD